MAGGFLALVPDGPVAADGGLAAGLRFRGWRAADVSPEWAEVWVRVGAAPPVAVDGGVLTLGAVFRRRATAPAPAGDEAPRFAAALCRTSWGAYAAVAREAGQVWLFRDPSGAREAIAWRKGAAWVIADSFDHLPDALAPDLSVDWDAVTDFARRSVAAAARPGLKGLVAPAAGEAVALGSGERAQVWTPMVWAGAPSPDAPATALRAALSEVCEAWTGAYGSLLAEISGGFDSALVATAARATPEGGSVMGALNYYGDRREGDERRWALAAAAAAGLELHTFAKPPRALVEADFAETAGGPRPSYAALDPARDRHTAETVARLGAQALFSGYGGDAAFYQMPSALPVADYLREAASCGSFGPVPLAAARWLRRSVWSLLSEARRGRLETDRVSYLTPFLGPRTCIWPDAAHPWLDGVAALPPGKRLQVLHLAISQLACGRSRRGAAADLLYPLMSQPVVEAALVIPSWRLVEGGRDRSLARSAVRDLLPPEIVERRSKGMLTSYYTRQVAESLGFLRPYLLDGRLASEGVLDRAAMEAALHPDRLIWRGDGAALLNAAAIEAWVRHWA